MLKRSAWKRSTPKKYSVPKDTGPTRAVKDIVIGRFYGRCARCGVVCWSDAASVHHRKPRGAGGTSDPKINNMSNLVYLCGTGTTGCHGWIEDNRELAREQGWLISRLSKIDPATVSITLWDDREVLLDDEGGCAEAPAETGGEGHVEVEI